jgi:hypothetical protein
MKRSFVAIGLFSALISTTAAAQSPTPSACAASSYHEFDFWIGDWVVHDTTGVYQGANRVEQIQGGCVLQENWTGSSGTTGTSFNIYDFTRRVWHQTWVSGPQLLTIEGNVVDGNMVLEGKTVGQGGTELFNRITWTPVAQDTVTQVWDTSNDGSSWQTVFYGVYTRR